MSPHRPTGGSAAKSTGRMFNQRTLLGATIDPIADKPLMLTAIYTLAEAPWFVVLVFAREAIILLGLAFMHCFLRRIKMGLVLSGKITTVLQMACVIWILLDFRVAAPQLPWLIWTTAVFMVIPTVVYL